VTEPYDAEQEALLFAQEHLRRCCNACDTAIAEPLAAALEAAFAAGGAKERLDCADDLVSWCAEEPRQPWQEEQAQTLLAVSDMLREPRAERDARLARPMEPTPFILRCVMPPKENPT
jgi:hypothetical protein